MGRGRPYSMGVGNEDDDDDLDYGAVSITIDRNLSELIDLFIDDVPDVVAMLPEADRQRVLELARQLDAEKRAERDQARLGSLLTEFRRISREAYERVGKPMYITFIGSRPVGD
jgi:hypothetical protein